MLKNRKVLFASLLILLSLVIVSWLIFFEYNVRWLEKNIEEVASDLRQKGYTVAYSKVEITGNPLFLKIIFQNPHLKDPKGLFDWHGQEMGMAIRPWQPYILTCTFPGDQKLGVPQNTPIPLGILQVEGARATISLASIGVLEEVAIVVDRISSHLKGQLQPVFLEEISLKVTNLLDPLNLSIFFKANVLNLEKPLNLPPRDHPFNLKFEGTLAGYQPTVFPKTLAEWRDGGGVIDVNSLKLSWPPLTFDANGTLTLDNNMYPLGAFSSRVIGYQDALADLVKLGWVKKKNASAVSFALDLFSIPDETGTKQLTIPITLQNKTLSVGPAPLLKLQPIEEF
ncbi:MAG TPA: DUF2125 domain-containing protein [Alphaproteobacteria bacterium]|nr:DUF2125 domain-containing protein [Alphaproteobacteria bacterium]